jgi:hypothetical protein
VAGIAGVIGGLLVLWLVRPAARRADERTAVAA